jgi:hypothetical protein
MLVSERNSGDRQADREKENNLEGRRGVETDMRWGETEVDNDVKWNGVGPMYLV